MVEEYKNPNLSREISIRCFEDNNTEKKLTLEILVQNPKAVRLNQSSIQKQKKIRAISDRKSNFSIYCEILTLFLMVETNSLLALSAHYSRY